MFVSLSNHHPHRESKRMSLGTTNEKIAAVLTCTTCGQEWLWANMIVDKTVLMRYCSTLPEREQTSVEHEVNGKARRWPLAAKWVQSMLESTTSNPRERETLVLCLSSTCGEKNRHTRHVPLRREWVVLMNTSILSWYKRRHEWFHRVKGRRWREECGTGDTFLYNT